MAPVLTHLLKHAEGTVASGGGGLRCQLRQATKRRHRHAVLLHWSENGIFQLTCVALGLAEVDALPSHATMELVLVLLYHVHGFRASTSQGERDATG